MKLALEFLDKKNLTWKMNTFSIAHEAELAEIRGGVGEAGNVRWQALYHSSLLRTLGGSQAGFKNHPSIQAGRVTCPRSPGPWRLMLQRAHMVQGQRESKSRTPAGSFVVPLVHLLSVFKH